MSDAAARRRNTALIGVIIAHVKVGDADPVLRSHYQFQIRTFWIGLLYGVISLLTIIIIIGIFGFLFLVVWMIVRCAKGLKLLSEGSPHENPGSWLW